MKKLCFQFGYTVLIIWLTSVACRHIISQRGESNWSISLIQTGEVKSSISSKTMHGRSIHQIGTIVAYIGPEVEFPDAWHACDGAKLDALDYPKLAGVMLGSDVDVESAGVILLPNFTGIRVSKLLGSESQMFFKTESSSAHHFPVTDSGSVIVHEVRWIMRVR